MAKQCINLVGQKFHKLTVIEFSHKEQLYRGQNQNGTPAKKGHRYYWICKCDCGNTIIVSTASLRNGTKSCGCLTHTHNLSDTRLYRIFMGMKQRCYNPNTPSYKDYGKRGIKICEEWLSDFTKFYDWAIANNYNHELSIDRINVSGDYEPTNCRWATPEQQSNNTRITNYIKGVDIPKMYKLRESIRNNLNNYLVG